jgi:hypothetical protein
MAYSYLNNNSELFLNDTLKQLESLSTKNSYETDPDDWYPGVDKSGNGLAVVRLLPPLEVDKVPVSIVRWFSHNFKNPNNDRWYIENSLKTFGEETADPVAEFNKKLWNSTKDDKHPNKDQARRQKRNINYRTLVYIVSDSANPENNGKVKKWRFGKTFYDLIKLAANPPIIEGALEQEVKINPFDLVKGANLKIQIFTEKKGGENRRNYSKSGFKEVSPLADSDTIDKIYNLYQSEPERWSLGKYVAIEKFKDYNTLKKRLDYVMEFNTKTGEPLESDEFKASPKETVKVVPKTSKIEDDDVDGFNFDSLKDD